jgi:hypothetical protein
MGMVLSPSKIMKSKLMGYGKTVEAIEALS